MYTPPPARLEELRAVHEGLGIERTVLVQPSVYGTDNTCLIDALRSLGAERARGVAVVDLDTVEPAEVETLHDAGVRGLRLNLHVQASGAVVAQEQVRRARRVLSQHGWALHVHASMNLASSLLDEFRRLEHPVVLDHFAGGLQPTAGSEQDLAAILAEMPHSPLYVKLSAPYRLWDAASNSCARLVREFHSAAPDRVLWGSDWPHTGGSGQRAGTRREEVEPFREVDDRQALADLLCALGEPTAQEQVLVRNPAVLYGWPLS